MSATENEGENPSNAKDSGKKNHNKYRQEKPWDTDDINHWEIKEWDPENDKLPSGSLLEESSFATLFPKYREKYLREVWPAITRTLDKYGIACELNVIEGSMTVKTTRKTSDPYIIMKARDLIKLLARSFPAPQAVKILKDEYNCDIIKIGSTVTNKDRFVKRRQRLVGPEGGTLKALELLTGCYILVQGNTVSTMGEGFNGIKTVRKVVLDCMKNVHPVYHIKRLMIMKELQKDEKLKNEDWSRFLPQFKKKNVQRKKIKTDKNTTKKAYTPFPPAQTPSKIDLQLDSGEYFLSERQRKSKKLAEKQALSQTRKQERMEARQREFEAPTSSSKSDTSSAVKSSKTESNNSSMDIDQLKSKFQKAGTKRKLDSAQGLSDYVDADVLPSSSSKEKKEKKKKKKSKKSSD